MKSNSNLILVLVLAGAGVALYTLLPPTKPSQPSTSSSKAPAVPAVKIKLYFFTMQGCAPCAQLKTSMKDAKVQQELSARFDLQMLTKTGDPLVKQYAVTSFPTLIALPSSGKVQHAGAMNPNELLGWLQGVK